MKVVIVNKFLYNRGGDCVAALSLYDLLIKNGHQAALFGVQHEENIKTEWNNYYPSSISVNGGINSIKSAFRLFYSDEVIRNFNKLIDDFQPDIIHVHNIHSYLSPVINKTAKKRGIKVIWTLHDYKLICPAYSCLNKNEVCTQCYSNKFNVVSNKCMKGSLLKSVLAWSESVYWNRSKLNALTDSFISPSSFLAGEMIKNGFPEQKMHVLHNFMLNKIDSVETEKENYYCYVGRISPEKGLEVLLKAAKNINYPLYIVGDGDLMDQYKKEYPEKHIRFLGKKTLAETHEIIKKARFIVVPSIWFENNPFSIIESLSYGTPVLGSKKGGIPELIEENENGFLFESGNSDELQKLIRKMLDDQIRFNYLKIAETAQNKFSSDTFYKQLINIYEQL